MTIYKRKHLLGVIPLPHLDEDISSDGTVPIVDAQFINIIDPSLPLKEGKVSITTPDTIRITDEADKDPYEGQMLQKQRINAFRVQMKENSRLIKTELRWRAGKER